MFDPKDLRIFFKRPNSIINVNRECSVFWTSVQIYLILVLISGIYNFVIQYILCNHNLVPDDETFSTLLNFKNNPLTLLIVISLVSPLFEEIIFRLPLIFSFSNLALAVSLLISLIIRKLTGNWIFILVFLTFYFFLIWINLTYESRLAVIWGKYFNIIVYFSSVLFGIIHIGNYRFININQIIPGIILVVPNILTGFIFSFVRIYYKKGFLLCLVTHSIMNLIAFLIYMLDKNLMF